METMNDQPDMSESDHRKDDVILAILRLSRALRRCMPEKGTEPFPPAVGRLLSCVGKNSGVSSRELCGLLDLRPSSLSEMLSRGETDGLIMRTADEKDRRIQHISLTEKGREIIGRMETEREKAYRKKISCFTEEEALLFCRLSERLTSHLESLAPKELMQEELSLYPRRPFGNPGFSPGPESPGSYPSPECRPDSESCSPGAEKQPKLPPRFPDEARFRS